MSPLRILELLSVIITTSSQDFLLIQILLSCDVVELCHEICSLNAHVEKRHVSGSQSIVRNVYRQPSFLAVSYREFCVFRVDVIGSLHFLPDFAHIGWVPRGIACQIDDVRPI